MTGYWFYISCAEVDWEPYLESFHHDLSRSLSHKTGLPESGVGYFRANRAQNLTEGFDPAIRALNNSRVLLPLLTPAYFLSDICRQEWQLFRLREQAWVGTLVSEKSYQSSTIPIFWDSERTLPRAPAAIDYHLRFHRSDFSEKYAREGLRQLMALSRYRDDYHEFLFTLTEKIYDIVSSFELPSINNLPSSADLPALLDAPVQTQAKTPVRTEIPTNATFRSPRDTVGGPPTGFKQEGPEKIFISYRRNDSEGFAGRLFDQLGHHFGEDQIFMDFDAIEPGEDFVEVIEAAVSVCHLMIVVIGKGWLTCTDLEGRRRLDNPDDFVRLEIATALGRGIRVIPVLVAGASVPRSNQLPEPLAQLARRNAFELSSKRWKYDVGRLIATIDKVLSRTASAGSERD